MLTRLAVLTGLAVLTQAGSADPAAGTADWAAALAASSVFSTLTGCTVSPLTSRTPRPKYSRASHSEYALFHSSARSL